MREYMVCLIMKTKKTFLMFSLTIYAQRGVNRLKNQYMNVFQIKFKISGLILNIYFYYFVNMIEMFMRLF